MKNNSLNCPASARIISSFDNNNKNKNNKIKNKKQSELKQTNNNVLSAI